MRVAVAGGTGVVGRHVVTALQEAGHDAVVLTRSNGVDLEAGSGLDAALAGVAAVVDASNVLTLSRDRSVQFFTAVTRHLLAAEERAGVSHHLALSIVGVDRVDFGYYEGKRRQEELVLAAPLRGTVLRATQFHEFAEQTLARSRGPVVVVPRMRSQPVAAREVGAELARLAVGPAAGLAPELAGPEVLEMTDMVRDVVRRRRLRRVVLPLRVPGQAGKAMAQGALLPAGAGPRGQQTFAEWLAER
jgi:uncharacterized protein YbjT (DUF2867 family)